MTNHTIILGATIAFGAIIIGYLFFKPSKPVLSADEFRDFPLIQKTEITRNTALYRFGLPQPTDILGLPIGQHISVAAIINEKQVVRSYTPVSSDDDRGYFDLLIKTYPTGNISRYVAQLQLGDTIKVRGPKGQFNYSPGLVKKLGMVAGGTGITPMMQIIRAIAKNPEDNTEVSLVYGNITEEDIILREEIEELAAKHSNIKVHFMLDRPSDNWTGGSGYVTADILRKHVPEPSSDVKLLLCGPPQMVSSVKKAAVELGYEKAKPVSKLVDQVFAF